MLRTFILAFLFCYIGTIAQIKELSPAMQWKLSDYNDSEFPLFVEFIENGRSSMVQNELGVVVGTIGQYTLIRTTKDQLLQMVNMGLCQYVGLDFDKGRPLNDQMILNNNVFPVHQGVSPLEQALTGEGIIMGVVDSGVEMDHPDFMHEDGSTRIVKLWDQLFIYDEEHIPVNYGWGTEWSSEEIDSDLADHQDQAQWFGHGSTVTGTACGNGSALDEYIGVAPATEMVVVSFDFSRPSFRANVASSIQYVFEVADEAQKPAVVNLSLGSYFGSHDGLDPAALYIDSLLEAQSGRIAVAAIGNANDIDPFHLRVDLDDDTSFTWFEVEDNLSVGNYGVFMELWADTADLSMVEFSFGADQIQGSYENRGTSEWVHFSDLIGQVNVKDIVNQNEDVLGSVQYWAQLRGEQIQIQSLILQPDSADYAYRFMGKGVGAYDIWSTATFGTSDMIQEEDLPTIDEFPDIAKYKSPDRLQHMVDSWTCSDKVISVANYVNRVEYVNYLNEITTIEGTQGDIYSTSSAGPTRDGRLKPDLAATGSTTLSTGNFAMLSFLIQNQPYKVAPGGMHFRNGGSSMASPVVAGVGALFLEQCPESNWEDFKNALYATTAIDGYTGEVPNPRWGMGKLNGYGA
ncbi:MAG: S8 family serine peptidase, partial [Flavobacteriales bacterium]|nr:S8 family serine peptidase [Flavobacteriales bacterium]